jgi:hypothetical protein
LAFNLPPQKDLPLRPAKGEACLLLHSQSELPQAGLYNEKKSPRINLQRKKYSAESNGYRSRHFYRFDAAARKCQETGIPEHNYMKFFNYLISSCSEGNSD